MAASKKQTEDISPIAVALKKALRKGPSTPAELAGRVERASARGLGPALRVLVALGHAVRHDDGSYSKAPKA